MLKTETSQTKPNNPVSIIFPEGKIIDSSSINKHLAQLLKAEQLNLDNLYNSIAPVKNVEAAVEIVSYLMKDLINSLSKKNMSTNSQAIQNTIGELFRNYKYEEFVNNKLLEKYKIKKLSEKEFKFEIGQNSCICTLNPSKVDNSNFIEKSFLKIQAMYHATCTAIKNNHNRTADKLIRDVLKTADLYLKVFSQNSYSKYYECADVISSIILLLKPEAQINAFEILKEHWHQNFNILLSFSNALIAEKRFDEVIKLLEPELMNIDDKALTNQDIGNCYYNLGHAYNYKGNYQLAKKYYLSTLEHSPNDQGAILQLFNIYVKLYEMENARNILNSLQSKDMKNLLEMHLDLSNVSTAKLKSLNKNVILKEFSFSIQILEYIAKYNQGKFSSDEQKATAFKKLSCNYNEPLLSTAIYTKQFNLAKEILQKIPTEEIFQNKFLWSFKTFLESEVDYESTQSVIEKNALQGAAAAEIINTASTVSIVSNDFTVVSQNVEKALEYDSQNEDSLELGIAAALLNNDKETAKEYASRLSEEKQQEIAANYSKDNEAENIEELIEQYDPREIHAHFQRIKQQKLVEAGQKITNTKVISSWKIGEQEVKKDNTTFIGKYKGLNCFTKISDEIEKKLDNNFIDSFTNAIQKGITYRKIGVNGVKFLQNKAVEVKIDGDMRLFTNIIHKNSQGDLLINFDHCGNHNEVENFANGHHLEILGNMDIYY